MSTEIKVLLNRRTIANTHRPFFGRIAHRGRCKGATVTSPNRWPSIGKDVIGMIASEPDAQGFVYVRVSEDNYQNIL